MVMVMVMAGERSARQGGKLETLLVQVASRKKGKRHAAPFRFSRFMTVKRTPRKHPKQSRFLFAPENKHRREGANKNMESLGGVTAKIIQYVSSQYRFATLRPSYHRVAGLPCMARVFVRPRVDPDEAAKRWACSHSSAFHL